jgi:spore cortex biosynthesis protein YabQ
MLAGFLFDLYRVLAQLLNFKKWGLVLGDVIYWLILTPVVFIILLWGNSGEVRFYVLIGLAIGALLYLRIFSQRLTPLIKAIYRLVSQVVSLIINLIKIFWRGICLPFKVIFIIVTVPFGFVIKILRKIVNIPKPIRGLIKKLRIWIKPNKT